MNELRVVAIDRRTRFAVFTLNWAVYEGVDVPNSYPIRGDVVWPARLMQPVRPPSLVYLDMNHYINLAKVRIGTAPQGYAELLDACRVTRADGRALFPLSSTHCVEISNIGSYQQREDVVAVMEELSDFNYLLGRSQIMRLEIEAAIDAMLGTADSVGEGEGIPLIGQSAFWAFGMRGGLIIEGEDGQEAEQRLRYRLGDQRFEQIDGALQPRSRASATHRARRRPENRAPAGGCVRTGGPVSTPRAASSTGTRAGQHT